MPRTLPSASAPRRTGILRLLRRLRRDERGVTAVEFAFIAGPFLLLIIALVETAVVHLTSLNLENAVKDAGRLIRTGQAQVAGMDAGAFRSAICQNIILIPDCSGNSDLKVDVRSYDDFNANPPALYDQNGWSNNEGYTPGAGGKVVVVRAYYKMDLLAQVPGIGLANLENHYRMLDAVSIFRNEPF
jgi:Flp pilus assembly protein TadG